MRDFGEMLSKTSTRESDSGGMVTPDSGGWQRSLTQAIRDPQVLLESLELDPSRYQNAHFAAQQFPVMVPRSYLRRMRLGDFSDPLLRQVLPVVEEELPMAGFTLDPVGDESAREAPGLLHKYAGRGLLIATGACAVHCRYCFRRHYPYGNEPRRMDDWEPAFQALEADPTLTEIILSGGDPLMVTDHRLGEIVSRLERIPHLTRLRIHSRLPIVLPDRVTESLLKLLQETRLTTIMVVHANHPAELVDDCADALRCLVRSGIPTLNQAVLLKGINDDVETLDALCRRSVDLGVMPYYLHQLDRVQGSAHFEVPVETGLRLIEGLRTRLPGYAVPRYVAEIAGQPSKTPLEMHVEARQSLPNGSESSGPVQEGLDDDGTQV